MLIDTHAHLYWESYKSDLDEVIQRSIESDVTTIINIGVNVEKSHQALKQVQDALSHIPEFSAYSTIGIHPHEALKYTHTVQNVHDRKQNVQEDVGKLEQIYLSDRKKVVAVGECGLDYYFDPEFTPSTLSNNQIKNTQKKLFQVQINLAKKLNLPLIVHCRDDRSKNPNNSEAWDEVLQMVGNHPAILHCYSGLPPTTNYILHTTNLLVSFAATITYPKNEYLREAAKTLPLDKICLETDCPFLPPQSKRGQRNEPSAVLEIAQLIADLKGLSLDEVANQTTKNVKTILSLSS